MNKSILLIIGGAFIMAVVVAMVVQAKLGSGTKELPTNMTEILVANKKLMIGETIKPEDVRWKVWPEDAVFKGMIAREDQEDEENLLVYEKPLRRSVESGEPVTMQTVIADVEGGGNNFLAAMVSPGMRAVAVSVKEETAVAGFLAPGDHVDVIVSYAPRLDSQMKEHSSSVIQRYASQTVLSNVRVLAVDQEAKKADREAKAAKTVTLEVNKRGAEILALADEMGDITLALRRMGEQNDQQDDSSEVVTDVSVSTALKKVREVQMRNDTTANTVRMYSGTDIQNVPVRSANMP